MNPSSPTPPGVTVIVTAFNYAGYLPEALHSVFSQDYPRKELIVVDDGSTDHTREVIRGQRSQVRYIHQTNSGLSAARNTGISLARNPFVAFLDADDLWRPTMLSTLMGALSRLPSDFVLAACRHENVDNDGQLLPKRWRDRRGDQEVGVEDVLVKNRFCADAVVVSRDVLRACGGFNTTLQSSEDRDMWIRVGQFGRLFLVDSPLLRVRVHSGSMSTHAERMTSNGRAVLTEAFRRSGVPRTRPFVRARALSFHCFQSAWMYYDEGHSLSAAKQLLKSLLLCPLFLRPGDLNEPFLFRVRALRRFLFCRHSPFGS